MTKPSLYPPDASKRSRRGALGSSDLSTTFVVPKAANAMKPAIQIEGLSKEYIITGRARGQYRTLREALTHAAVLPWQKLRQFPGLRKPGTINGMQTVQALNDVSFNVMPGEIVGVIGRNGAGKSTLLKILSQVTEPTYGRVSIRGRLASLLEVGTGFHQELSGRENVYLSGVILGMSRREVHKKFDAIVEFADIGDYIDTAAKRYSSGMLVRLAFAVAAHLDPDVLLLDEVLAVGDAGFRAKCIRRMKELISSGVAALFVSHQRSQIAEICQRCVVLHHGRLVYSGDSNLAWQRYVELLRKDQGTSLPADPGAGARIAEVKIVDGRGTATNVVFAQQPLSFLVNYDLDRDIAAVGIGVNFFEASGSHITDCTTLLGGFAPPANAGNHSAMLHLEGLPLAAGTYTIVVRLYHNATGTILDRRVYPLVVEGVADQYAVRFPYYWSAEFTSPRRTVAHSSENAPPANTEWSL